MNKRHHIKLPDGYAIGMTIVTNEIYARITPRAPGPIKGVIIGGSKSAFGDCVVQLNTYKKRCILPHTQFNVINDKMELTCGATI